MLLAPSSLTKVKCVFVMTQFDHDRNVTHQAHETITKYTTIITFFLHFPAMRIYCFVLPSASVRSREGLPDDGMGLVIMSCRLTRT